MKVTVNRPTKIEVKWVNVILPIHYGTEDMPMDFPLRDDELWSAVIDVDTGIIQDWPNGQSGEFYMKVCDSGEYYLMNGDAETVAEIKDYVPHGLIPGEYGDYVNFKINSGGRINNWPKNPNLEAFFP